MYTCPVCGYDSLRFPPDDYTICPSCGTKFSYSDITKTHSELRSEWLAQGANWQSTVIPAPVGWNAAQQLGNLNSTKLLTKATLSTQGRVHWVGHILHPPQAQLSSVRIECFGSISDLVDFQAMHI